MAVMLALVAPEGADDTNRNFRFGQAFESGVFFVGFEVRVDVVSGNASNVGNLFVSGPDSCFDFFFPDAPVTWSQGKATFEVDGPNCGQIRLTWTATGAVTTSHNTGGNCAAPNTFQDVVISQDRSAIFVGSIGGVAVLPDVATLGRISVHQQAC